jgi:5,10-methylenetetrahydromethanopterin reductase
MPHPSVSVAFATSPSSPDDIALAEHLGYERAWLYDTPQQSPDVWMALALAAQRTESIGLGPGVLVPSLRHPMVNAAATRMLQGLAPGRVAVAFGTGFTGRAAMGLTPLTWSYMRRYLTAYQRLLRGEVAEWDGARMRMLPPEQHPQTPPAPPPILVSAMGPKGAEVARAIGADGLFSVGAPGAAMGEFGWAALLVGGTVLDDGESPGGPRVREAAGPTWALTYHYPYTAAGADGVRDIPGGPEWLAVIEKTPEPDRHLAVHTGHLVRLNEADTAAWEAGGSALVTQTTLTAPAAGIRQAVSALADQGVTEIVYQPSGPDIRRELEAFIEAAGPATGSDP